MVPEDVHVDKEIPQIQYKRGAERGQKEARLWDGERAGGQSGRSSALLVHQILFVSPSRRQSSAAAAGTDIDAHSEQREYKLKASTC